MRFPNILIFILALPEIVNSERPRKKNYKISKNKINFCLKYQAQLSKISYSMYPALGQVNSSAKYVHLCLNNDFKALQNLYISDL